MIYRWTHIVVDYVEGKKGIYKVIFIATARGSIRKLVQLPGTDKTCLIEEIDLVPNGDHKPVKQLQISREKVMYYQYTCEVIYLAFPVVGHTQSDSGLYFIKKKVTRSQFQNNLCSECILTEIISTIKMLKMKYEHFFLNNIVLVI